MRRYIRNQKTEAHFVLMDFFCHGVPSMHLWRKIYGNGRASDGKNHQCRLAVTKATAGHDSLVMAVSGEKKVTYHSRKAAGTFSTIFPGNLCLNEPCYDRCKYKIASSAADIRSGDLWGKTYAEDEAGVSAVLAFFGKKGDTC